MADVYLAKGDRLPALAATLTDGRGNPVNLTAATGVTFTMLNQAGSTIINAVAATVVNAAGGQVSYPWGASDTTTDGAYTGRFAATFAGLVETFPNDRWLQIVITG